MRNRDGLDFDRILRAMKLRYQTQALQNVGFYLMQTRPLFFIITALFFLCNGHRWFGTKGSMTLHIRVDGLYVLEGYRKEHLL